MKKRVEENERENMQNTDMLPPLLLLLLPLLLLISLLLLRREFNSAGNHMCARTRVERV